MAPASCYRAATVREWSSSGATTPLPSYGCISARRVPISRRTHGSVGGQNCPLPIKGTARRLRSDFGARLFFDPEKAGFFFFSRAWAGSRDLGSRGESAPSTAPKSARKPRRTLQNGSEVAQSARKTHFVWRVRNRSTKLHRLIGSLARFFTVAVVAQFGWRHSRRHGGVGVRGGNHRVRPSPVNIANPACGKKRSRPLDRTA